MKEMNLSPIQAPNLDGEEEEEEQQQQGEEIWCHLIVPFTIEDVQAPAVVMKGLP
jgi:hypothetical protein